MGSDLFKSTYLPLVAHIKKGKRFFELFAKINERFLKTSIKNRFRCIIASKFPIKNYIILNRNLGPPPIPTPNAGQFIVFENPNFLGKKYFF